MVQKKKNALRPWVYVATGILLGALVVAVGVVVFKPIPALPQKSASPPAAPQHVIVVETKPKMPIYPEKDPQYPLRADAGTAEYQQMGVLTSVDGSEPVALPLFGRRMANRPDRWEYYTATDKQNMLRVPITFEKRDCLEDVGCNEVYKGDKVTVPVYGKTFEVQLYKYAP